MNRLSRRKILGEEIELHVKDDARLARKHGRGRGPVGPLNCAISRRDYPRQMKAAPGCLAGGGVGEY